jgi:hypothetical protein
VISFHSQNYQPSQMSAKIAHRIYQLNCVLPFMPSVHSRLILSNMLLENSSSTIGSCFDRDDLERRSEGEANDEIIRHLRKMSVSLHSPVDSSSEQENMAYTEMLQEVENLERQLERDMVELLQNQAGFTELRINAIQSLLQLKTDCSEKTRKKTHGKSIISSALTTSMRDIRIKKLVRFQVIKSKSKGRSDGRRRFELPGATFSI